MDTDNYQLVSLSQQRATRLLLAALCCLVFSTLTQAHDFTVPGTSGHNWLNTGLDIAPGALLQLSADGRVDVGYDWGSFGPEGTTRFADSSGYPADTPFRYGLVARLTASRTTPEDDLREQWSYGEAREYCAAQGGHLWLTVNDDDPGNNTGSFMVHVAQTTCPSQTERGQFRVTLTGFLVNNETVDTLFEVDGRGDEVYTATEVAELSSANRIFGPIRRLESLTYGDTSAGNSLPARIRAGNRSPTTGGLQSGNSYPVPGESPPMLLGSSRARMIPMILWQGELRGGPNANAVVILPTIWELDNDQSPMLSAWHSKAQPELIRFASTSAPLVLGRVQFPLKTRVEVLREPVDRNDFDRPIGMDGDSFFPFVARTATFSPFRIFLNFSSAQAAATSTANSFTHGRGIVDIEYGDGRNYGPGRYTMFLSVERLP